LISIVFCFLEGQHRWKKSIKEAQTAFDRALAKAVAEFANTVAVPYCGGWVARNGNTILFMMFQKVPSPGLLCFLLS
jgi:hypothetical protein